MMTPERWQQAKAIFHAALERAPGERSAFLTGACAGDDALRKEVESLIAAHEKGGSFIDSPAFEASAGMLAREQELQPGQTISHYQIIAELGEGGMGVVYLAHDKQLNRKVALKFLPSSFTKDEDRLRRFDREARAASALNHPNILTIHEIGEVDGRHFIATEFVDGQTLRDRLKDVGLEVNGALDIATQIASALREAHDAGIIHRDIKPENIMLRRDGIVKVLDFGLAKLGEQENAGPEDETLRLVQTSTGVVMGTVTYMSPEQARGLAVDPRTDIWSLGVVIYELLTSEPPFRGSTTSDILVAVLEREPSPLSSFVPKVPPGLQRIVSRALAKDREGRYQSVKDLQIDLKNIVAENGGTGKTAPETVVRETIRGRMSFLNAAVDWPRRNKLIASIALLILAAGVIAVTLALRRQTGRSEPREITSVVRTMQVTFSTGLDHFPSLSPDGNSITYSSDQNGSFEIYVKQLIPGGRDMQLTSDGQQNLEPAWSPDGRHIAYYSRNRGGIWIVPALGGNPKQLVEFGSRPAWSLDGSTIAFQSGAASDVGQGLVLAPSTIWSISSGGGSPRQITRQGTPPGGHSFPTWSPDGKHIAFQVSEYISTSIWQVSVEGGGLRKLVDDGRDPIYVHDGGEIYLIGAGGESGLSKIRLSSSGEPLGRPESMVGGGPGTGMRHLTISADGKKIAYTVTRTTSTLWTILLSGKSISEPTPFARDTSPRNTSPRFSHDGRKVAMTKFRTGTGSDIWIADADGKNLTQLTTNPANDLKASWYPQDDKILFDSEREHKNATLWSISLATGKEERLLELDESAAFFALSPDGKQVAFNSNKSGTINMWIGNLAGGEPKQLTFSDKDRMGFPCWSPDGQFLAFLSQHGNDGYLMIMPARGGQPEQLTFEGSSYVYSWSPRGDKLAFAGERDRIWNIYWISRDTKEQKQLTNYSKLNAFVRYPDWSPLGNQIVYEYTETSGNIWLMELK